MVHPAGFEPAGLHHVRAALSRLRYGCRKDVDHSGVEPDPHLYKKRVHTATPVVRRWLSMVCVAPRSAPGRAEGARLELAQGMSLYALAGRCLTNSANLPWAEAVGFEPTGPERPAVFKTAAIAALPSLHAAEGKGLEPPDAHHASRFRGGCIRRSATPPKVPASAGGGESRTRTYGGPGGPFALPTRRNRRSAISPWWSYRDSNPDLRPAIPALSR